MIVTELTLVESKDDIVPHFVVEVPDWEIVTAAWAHDAAPTVMTIVNTTRVVEQNC